MVARLSARPSSLPHLPERAAIAATRGLLVLRRAVEWCEARLWPGVLCLALAVVYVAFIVGLRWGR